MNDGPATPPPKAPNATAKALRVLAAVSEPPGAHRLNEIVTGTALAKTSVYRLLRELIENGFVARDPSGAYRPDTGLQALAAKVNSTDDSKTIRALLTRLQRKTGNTIHYAVRMGDRAVYLDKVEGKDQSLLMASRPGKQIQLHTTALGKAIIAYMPEPQIRGYARRNGLPPATERSLTTIDALLADAEAVRERGFAIDDEENEPQIRCIAAPVLNPTHEPIGGVSVSTVVGLVTREQLMGFAHELINTTQAISKTLNTT